MFRIPFLFPILEVGSIVDQLIIFHNINSTRPYPDNQQDHHHRRLQIWSAIFPRIRQQRQPQKHPYRNRKNLRQLCSDLALSLPS